MKQFKPLEDTEQVEQPVMELETVPVQPFNVAVVDDIDDLNNPDLIWCRDKFPSATRSMNYTPRQLYNTLIEYSGTVTPFTELLAQNSIDCTSFYKISDRYAEIRELYSRARTARAKKFGEIAEKIYTNEPEFDWLYQSDAKTGARVLTTAGAAYLKNKTDNAHRIAAIMETGSYIATSKQETINRNLSMTVTMRGKLPEGFDLATADTSALIDAIKGRGKR
jgi:hypothetical protein